MNKFITIILFFIFSTSVIAETYKEVAKVNYKKFRGTAKQEVMDQAMFEACSKAISKYANTFDDARYENFLKVKSKIENNINDYVNCTLIEDEQDKKAKTYTVVVKAEIMTKAFNAVINQSSSISDTDSLDKSEIAFAFFAREIDEAKSFKTKTFERTDTSASETTSEIAASDGTETVVSGTTDTSTSSTTGGSSVAKSGQLVYSSSPDGTDQFIDAMLEFFNKANYDLIDLYDINDDVADLYDEMIEEFGIEGTPSRRTLSKINKILQEEEIGFFVYGTLSLGQKEVDQSTGNNITKASISGTVFDLTGKRAKRISSIAPQVVSGLGTTQDESRRLAIANSAKQSSDILINVLNKRGIK
jgi:hypothetical protein